MTALSARDAAAGDDAEEVPLPTFPVTVRLTEPADTPAAAISAVRARLAPVRGLFSQVVADEPGPGGTWILHAEFVVVSVDAHTAVTGVHETLRAAGIAYDEAWAAPQPV